MPEMIFVCEENSSVIRNATRKWLSHRCPVGIQSLLRPSLQLPVDSRGGARVRLGQEMHGEVRPGAIGLRAGKERNLEMLIGQPACVAFPFPGGLALRFTLPA